VWTSMQIPLLLEVMNCCASGCCTYITDAVQQQLFKQSNVSDSAVMSAMPQPFVSFNGVLF
jgi:hypothetical protein